MYRVPIAGITTAIASLSLLTLFATSASAQTTLNFESLTGMTNAPGAPIPIPSQLSSQFLASDGVLFTSGSGTPFVAVVDLGGGTSSPPNAIGGATSEGNLTYTGPAIIVARFFNPADGLTPFATDSVSITGDTIPDGGTFGFRAFDALGNFLGGVSGIDTGGTTFTLDVSNIHRVEIDGSGTVGIDDFTFGPIAPAELGANAPEPVTLALILPTVILFFASRRRH